jgi:hypothetical protein
MEYDLPMRLRLAAQDLISRGAPTVFYHHAHAMLEAADAIVERSAQIAAQGMGTRRAETPQSGSVAKP